MSLETLVTLTIRETGTSQRPVFMYNIFVDNQAIAISQNLVSDQSQSVRDLARRYNELFMQRRGPRLARDRLWAIGAELFRVWLAPFWQKITDNIPYGAHTTFVIASQESQILNLPWELLYPPDGQHIGLNAAYHIVRLPYSSLSSIPQSRDTLKPFMGKLPPGPPRILCMCCAPHDQAVLDYEHEEEALLDAVVRAGAEVAWEMCETGTFAELQQRIQTFQPHIVHLTGHGMVRGDGEGYLAFENEQGFTDLRSAQDIRQLFDDSNVQCVFVSGCQSSKIPAIDVMGSICQQLVTSIPLAVACAESVANPTIAQFVASFYKKLCARQPVDRALIQARLAIQSICNQNGDPAWTLPVLYATTMQRFVFTSTNTKPRGEPPTGPTNQPQPPLPTLTESYTTHLAGRRREIQCLLPALQHGNINTVLITGISGVGKSTLATFLAHQLQASGFTPIHIVSKPGTPLTAALLLQHCSEVLQATGQEEAYRRLNSPNLAPETRLRTLVSILNQHRFVFLLDNFEVNLDDTTGKIADKESSTINGQKRDTYNHYETGLHALTTHIADNHPHFTQMQLYHQQLTENIRQSRLYGDNPALKKQRAEVIDYLNTFALTAIGKTFHELCKEHTPEPQFAEHVLAGFYTFLLKNLSGHSCAIITSRYPPADLLLLPATAYEKVLGDISRATFLRLLLQDTAIAHRYRTNDLTTADLQQLYATLGGQPRFLEQVRCALRDMPVSELRTSLETFDLPSEPLPARLHHLRETYCTHTFVAYLYNRLSEPLRHALNRVAVYTIAVPLEGWTQVANVPSEHMQSYVAAWLQAALVYPITASPLQAHTNETNAPPERWCISNHVRTWWLLAQEGWDEHEQMKAAHQAAGRYLEHLAQENPSSLAGLSPLECLLEARRHYIAARNYAPARQITARISEEYRAAGFLAEIERLNREILEYAPHPLPIVWIGQSHLDRGDILLAHEWFEHGLAITDSAPTEESAHCWYALGMMALNQGDDSTARRMFNHLVDLYHQMGNLAAEASAWQQLALLDMNAENDDAARQKLERTLSLEQATSNRANEARTFYELGFLAAKAQQFETGLRLTTLALLILRGIGHPDQQNVEAGVNALLAHLGYSSDQFNALIQQVEADYQQDDGWQMVRSFHELRPDQQDPIANQTDRPARTQP